VEFKLFFSAVNAQGYHLLSEKSKQYGWDKSISGTGLTNIKMDLKYIKKTICYEFRISDRLNDMRQAGVVKK